MIGILTPQARINSAECRDQLRSRCQIACSFVTALILLALAVGGCAMLLHIAVSLPSVLAEAAARSAR